MALPTLWILTLLSSVAALTMAAENLSKDCSEVKDLDNAAKSGLYNVNPDGRGSFLVYCDMETDGGGWTVFQRRKGGKKGNNFARTWAKYKRGFGKLNGNFWLGNEYLHRLTANQTVRLRIEVEGWSKKHAFKYAEYNNFATGDERSLYSLTVSGYKGTAGNALGSHNSMPFSTFDKDNDDARRNCAQRFRGGWWFKSCLSSNLNGEYKGNVETHGPGIVWLKGKLRRVSLKFSEMKLRPAK